MVTLGNGQRKAGLRPMDFVARAVVTVLLIVIFIQNFKSFLKSGYFRKFCSKAKRFSGSISFNHNTVTFCIEALNSVSKSFCHQISVRKQS